MAFWSMRSATAKSPDVVSQLALPLRLADHAVFASFHAAGNEPVVAALSALAQDHRDDAVEGGIWLWGPSATGKSHLLQAACEAQGDQSVFLPLNDVVSMDPGVTEGLASRALICIDDIDVAAGNAAWEQALFNLYNEVQAAGGRLVTSASAPPRSAGFELADLQSRLSQLAIFRLNPLDDEQSAVALQLRASHRGLDLPDDTAHFLLNHARRDMASLYALLDQLDDASLRAKRRLTIPFVKSVLAGD